VSTLKADVVGQWFHKPGHITGADSHPALRTIAARLAGGLRQGELLELAHGGHVTYAEQPSAFATAVRAFTAHGSSVMR
jgi:pimeloyl-ACP methyl ester carboxylesterase